MQFLIVKEAALRAKLVDSIVFSLMMRGNLPPSSAMEDDFCDFPLSDCFIMDMGEKAEFCV